MGARIVDYNWVDVPAIDGADATRVLIVRNNRTGKSVRIDRAIAADRIGDDGYGSRDDTERLIAKIAADCSGDLDRVTTRLVTGPAQGATIRALQEQIEYWKRQAEEAASRATMPRP